jgi:CheY-like chemotaxis protein
MNKFSKMSSRGSHKKLFIIDDDIEDQEIFIEAVKEVDNSILCYNATSGEDALKQLEGEVLVLPDLIFLDMNMPRLNGKQVLKAIKNSRSLRAIPVIMYSTSFAPRDIEEISKMGAAFHLLKPSRFDDLCKALRVILSKDWYVENIGKQEEG